MTIESIESFFARAGIPSNPNAAIIEEFIKSLAESDNEHLIDDEYLISLRIKLVRSLSAEQMEIPVLNKLNTLVYEQLKGRKSNTLSFSLLKKIESVRNVAPSTGDEAMRREIANIANCYLACSGLENMVDSPYVRNILILELNNALDDAGSMCEGVEEVVVKFEDEVERGEAAAAVPMRG
jgi:hypothetical protein